MKSLTDIESELANDLGPKISRMYEKACETDPEKKTYGPETSEKVWSIFLAFLCVDQRHV